MKTFQIILVFSLLSLSITTLGQRQKYAVTFEPEDLKRTIQLTFDSLKTEINLTWVYYKVANFDTSFISKDTPPPPNFITSFGFSDFELQAEDFENVKILKESPEKLFGEIKSQIDTLSIVNIEKKRKFGNGLVFSLPYSNLSENKKFVDIKIINWDWCGTDAETRVELKE